MNKDENVNAEGHHEGVIKHLLLSTALYLPLCFFIWFYSASLLVIPVKHLLQFVLSTWQSDLFNVVTQNRFMLNIETLIFPSSTFTGQGDQLAVLDVAVNPMLYGYGMALITGLVISIPRMKRSKRILQIVFGYVLVIFIQTFGSFWQLVKNLAFEGGPDANQAIMDTGLSMNVIALIYQMSYLIIPAVVPVAYWIIINGDFIGEITGLKTTTNRNFDDKTMSDKQE